MILDDVIYSLDLERRTRLVHRTYHTLKFDHDENYFLCSQHLDCVLITVTPARTSPVYDNDIFSKVVDCNYVYAILH